MGDYTTLKNVQPDLTAEEKAKHARIRKEIDSLQKEYSGLISKLYGSDRVKDEEKRKKYQEEFKKYREKVMKLRSKIPEETTRNGRDPSERLAFITENESNDTFMATPRSTGC